MPVFNPFGNNLQEQLQQKPDKYKNPYGRTRIGVRFGQ